MKTPIGWKIDFNSNKNRINPTERCGNSLEQWNVLTKPSTTAAVAMHL